jgi:hypothetical protein
MLGVFLAGGFAYSIASVQHPESAIRIRIAILAVIGSLLGYNYLALGFPGTEDLFSKIGQLSSLFTSIAGGGILLIIALVVIKWIDWR